MKGEKSNELMTFLVEEVLRYGSDTLPAATEKRLSEIRREKPSVPVIYVSSGSAAVIAGSEKSAAAADLYLKEMGINGLIVSTGGHGPAVFEPLFSVQLPGKNRLVFRNITEDKVEVTLNGVFHNDMPDEDLVAQSGSTGFEAWHGIPFIEDIPFFKFQKRVVLENFGFYDPESIEEYIARGGYRSFLKTIRNYTHEEVCDIVERSGLRGRSGGVSRQDLSGSMLLTRHQTTGISYAMPRRVIPALIVTGRYWKVIRTG